MFLQMIDLVVELRYAPSPLVILTGAQRSGGTCGSVALPWECFFDGGTMGFGPPKLMKATAFQQPLSLEAPPSPPVIPTRAQRSGEICVPSLEMFSTGA
jgi:hypothetical protein